MIDEDEASRTRRNARLGPAAPDAVGIRGMPRPRARIVRVVGGRGASGAPPPPDRSLWGRLRAIARSRLVHFMVAGGLIFALAPRPPASRDIVIDGATLEALERAQAQRIGTPVLAPEEERDIRARAIEDELLYREALRLGFDHNDNIVRQRLIQKVLFLAEDLAGVPATPSEEELRAFFETTRSQWTRPAQVRFIHVYAGTNRHDQLLALRGDVVAAERAAPGVPPSLGEAFPLPRTVSTSRDALAVEYGPGFADAVFLQEPGTWSEPVQSKFGWHLVKVVERQEAGPATFEDVRDKLPLTYLVARKKRAVADFLQRAATRYRITVDGKPLTELPSSGRTAPPRVEKID